MNTGIEEMSTNVIDIFQEDEVVGFASNNVRVPSFFGEETPEISYE